MKTIKVLITDIEVEFDVRAVQTNPEHAQMLLDLMTSGIPLPPIEIYKKKSGKPYGVNDGRHRIEAYKMAGETTIPAIVIEVHDGGLRVLEGFMKNLGGALPPTKQDFIHTVELLIEKEGWSVARIEKTHTIFAPYTKFATSNIHHRKLAAAKKAVLSSVLTVQQACKQYGVKEETLKTEMGLKKQKVVGVGLEKNRISSVWKAFRGGMQGRRRNINILIKQGEYDAVEAFDILAHSKRLLEDEIRNFNNWETQVRNLCNTWETKTNS